MARKLRIWIEAQGESLQVPELFSHLIIHRDAPPIPHYIIAQGRTYAPSHDVPPHITLDAAQAWGEWLERNGFDETPRQFIDKLSEIRASNKPVRFVIESDKHETYPQNFLALINLRETSIEVGQESDIMYGLDIYRFDNHEMKELEISYTGDEVIVNQPDPSRDDERPPPPRTYTVVSGDNLTRIARQHGQSDSAWRELHAANPQIANPHLIFPNQVLNIPESWL